eukprot:TRINITY_DN3663_c0_g3_i1.p1 TRINITY_DN3663_c0_g3~~TRINITY_DN3663_c0_g3_i1.p1  ORF type:complete len:177 (+),score=61.05 TRINITY_DN3663_c0_g3_i1:123-653(+)
MSYYKPKLMLFPVKKNSSIYEEDLRELLRTPGFIKRVFEETGIEMGDAITLDKFKEACYALGHHEEFKAMLPILKKIAKGTEQVNFRELEDHLKRIADLDLQNRMPKDEELGFLLEHMGGEMSVKQLYEQLTNEIESRKEFDVDVLKSYAEDSRDVITPSILKRYLQEHFNSKCKI